MTAAATSTAAPTAVASANSNITSTTAGAFAQDRLRLRLTPAMDALLDTLADAEALLNEPQDLFNTRSIGVAERADGLRAAACDSAQVIGAQQVVNHWDYNEEQE